MFIFIRHDIHLYVFIYHLNFLRVTFSKCLRIIQRMFLWLGNTLKWLGIHHLPNIFNSVIIVKSILQRFSVRHVLVIVVRNVKLRKRIKMTRKHQIVSLISSNQDVVDLLYCTTHTKKKLECYCDRFIEPVCTNNGVTMSLRLILMFDHTSRLICTFLGRYNIK